jgi:streptogramin lyase
VGDLAVTGDAVWVSSGLFRVAPGTNAVTGPFTTAQSQDIGAGEGSVWASGYDQDVVRRFDSSTGSLVATIKLGGGVGSSPEGMVDAAGSMWVGTHHGGALLRIDAQTNTVSRKVLLVPSGSGGPQGVAAGLGSIWVDVPSANAVFRIDPNTAKVVAVISLPDGPSACGGIAVGTSAVWVTSCLDGTLIARIDPATNRVVSVLDVGGEVIQPAAEGDTVWFVAGGDPDNPPAPAHLIQLRADDSVMTRIALPTGFVSGGTAVAFGSVWVSDFVHPQLIRVPDHSG